MLLPTRIVGGGVDAQHGRQYDVARDGRFLINIVLENAETTPITLLQNCHAEVKNDVQSEKLLTRSRRRMIRTEAPMRIEKFSFGQITVEGISYEHDVVIDHGKVRKRNKKPSKKLRDAYAHTPLSASEEIPWKCRRLVIGTGVYGNLPVMDEVKQEAARRDLELVLLPTAEAIKALRKASRHTNAILHITC